MARAGREFKPMVIYWWWGETPSSRFLIRRLRGLTLILLAALVAPKLAKAENALPNFLHRPTLTPVRNQNGKDKTTRTKLFTN
jgi:hypothetical protein